MRFGASGDFVAGIAVFFVTAFFGATFTAAAGEGRDAGRGLGEDFAGAFFAILVTGFPDVDFFAISIPNKGLKPLTQRSLPARCDSRLWLLSS